MDSTVIVAILSLGGTILGSGLGVVASSRLTSYRLEQLEKKVEAHNNLITRMYGLEERMGIEEEKQKVAGHRLDDLEHQNEVKVCS